MPEQILTIEFDAPNNHAGLFMSMCRSSLEALESTNAISKIGPIELRRASEESNLADSSAGTPVQQLKAKMPTNKEIEIVSMAIVHRIGENCGVSVPVRQSTNDVNINETIAKLKTMFGTSAG